MREAQLEAQKFGDDYVFKKRRLLESTSMVHTPLRDVKKPDLSSFPEATGIYTMDCSEF